MVCICKVANRIKITCRFTDVQLLSTWKKLNVTTPFSKAHRKKTVPCLVATIILAAVAAMGQNTIGYSENTSPTPGLPSGIGQSTAQNPFTGSVPQGKATPQVLSLSFKDAIDLALKNNLGLLLQGDNTLSARGQKWKELSALLPDLTTKTSENVNQINLAAEGIRIPIPGFPNIIGPYSFFDTRAYLTQSLFDLHSIQREHGAAANESAARYSYKDARDIVVLAAGNMYLQCISAAARVESSQVRCKLRRRFTIRRPTSRLPESVQPLILFGLTWNCKPGSSS
jgi:hypothetical protein